VGKTKIDYHPVANLLEKELKKEHFVGGGEGDCEILNFNCDRGVRA